MSTHPRLEARVKAIENRQINTDTHIEEVTGEIAASVQQLSKDMADSFKGLSDYMVETEEKTEKRFKKIEETMATKEDLAAMESRILNAFQQLIATIKPQ